MEALISVILKRRIDFRARGVLCPVHGEDVTFEEVLAAVSNPHPFELTRLARDTWPGEGCNVEVGYSRYSQLLRRRAVLPGIPRERQMHLTRKACSRS